jgi:hypothetical protein
MDETLRIMLDIVSREADRVARKTSKAERRAVNLGCRCEVSDRHLYLAKLHLDEAVRAHRDVAAMKARLAELDEVAA